VTTVAPLLPSCHFYEPQQSILPGRRQDNEKTLADVILSSKPLPIAGNNQNIGGICHEENARNRWSSAYVKYGGITRVGPAV